MYFLRKLPKKAIVALVFSSSVLMSGAAVLEPSGAEYRFLPALPGDQMLPQVSFGPKGGYLVTQDNSIDGNGLGIRARRYYSDLSASRWTFQVNSEGAGEQQNGHVAMLENDGAVFAWQGSTPVGNRIFVRALDANGIFTGPDTQASADPVGNQTDPALCVLANQTAVVVWAEWKRDGDMQGIFAQRITADGFRLGTTFQVNQGARLSQRSPAVVGLSNGNFVVAWVSDEQRHENSIDIYARIFSASGAPLTGDFRLNSSNRVCANPALVAVGAGFRAGWSARDLRFNENNWDVETRLFNASGEPAAPEVVVNNVVKGDQFSPRFCSVGAYQMILWTSFGQDGSDEGIFARVIGASGFAGKEFQVNTRTISKQRYPAAGAIGQTVLVTWSAFMGGVESYDLLAQNYSLSPEEDLAAPQAPFVSSLSANSICVSWPEAVSLAIDRYLIYVDGEPAPEESSSGMLVLTRSGWAPSSIHSIRLGYRTADGRLSLLSPTVTVQTWGVDANGDGLPDDWQTQNWGKRWPPANEDSDGDGATNAQEFLAGTDPTDPKSVLRVEISLREQGRYLQWNTEAGNYYQPQVTTDFHNWQSVGTPRFAPSTSDSVPISAPGQVQYYRVIRMR